MGMPAVPCGSPSSEKRMRLPVLSATNAKQLCVASECSARTLAINALASSSLSAWAQLAIKRERSMTFSYVVAEYTER